MNKEYLFENLTIDDLGEDKKLLFNTIGKEKFIEICLAFGGSTISIPQEHTLHTAIAKRKIRESKELVQSGILTAKELARMHKVSSAFIYRVLEEKT